MAETPAGFAPDQPSPRSGKRAAADWRGTANAPSHGKLVAVTLVLLLAVAGVIAGLVLWPKPPAEPRFVAVPIDQYGPLWAVNPWAEADAAKIGEPFGDRASTVTKYQQADKFHQWLDWLAAKPGATSTNLPTDFESRPLIVYITGFAAVKSDGVFLLLPRPQSGSFAESVEWLSLDALLDAIAACPAKQKLLILDIAHPVADPFNGILDDSASTALDALLKARTVASKLPCAVLTSCGPGQVSLPCQPERSSAFAFYLAEGLRGAADGSLDPGGLDERITVRELERFVLQRVDRWAGRVHGVHQTPTLYAEDRHDFVVSYKQKFPENRYEPHALAPYPAGLAEAWRERAAASEREYPVARARWTAGLLRAEQLWARAGASDRAEDARRSAREVWNDEARDSGRPVTAADVLKAARFRLPAGPLNADLGKLLDALLVATPEEEAKAKAAWTPKAAEAPLDAARLVWKRACDAERPERKDLKRWHDALAPLKLPYAEVLLIERLAGYDFTQKLARPPSEGIAALIQAETAVGRIAAAAPNGFAAMSESFAKADANRRVAERLLFEADSREKASAAAARLLEAVGELDRTLKRLNARREARVLAEASRIVLLDTLAAALEPNGPDFATWKTAGETLHALLTKLSAAEANPASDGGEWAEEAAALPQRVAALRAPFDAAAKEKETPPAANAADLAKRAVLLAGPALNAEARAAIGNAWLHDLAALHAAVRQMDRDDEGKSPLAAPPPAAAISSSATALRRAEASLLLLKLAGAAESAECATALAAVKADANDAAAWERLGKGLQSQWKSLPRDSERAARTTPAELARFRDPAASRPWIEAAKADAAAQRRWILKQLLDDEPLRSRGDAAKKFYGEVRSEANRP